MFEPVFKALKRMLDLSLIPLLIGAFAIFIEMMIGGVSYVLVLLVKLVVSILVIGLSWVPFPDLPPLETVLPSEFFQLAHVMGIFPAMLVYMGGAVIAAIVRVLTLGLVSRGGS